MGETHRRYTRAINVRKGWRGYLWQGRFASVPLDEAHLLAAFRSIEHNPVAAGLVAHAEDYPWSSARAPVRGSDDPVLSPHPLQGTIGDWRTLLRTAEEPTTTRRLEQQLRTGRPQGAEAFVQQLEQTLGRPIRKRRPGPQLVGIR